MKDILKDTEVFVFMIGVEIDYTIINAMSWNLILHLTKQYQICFPPHPNNLIWATHQIHAELLNRMLYLCKHATTNYMK